MVLGIFESALFRAGDGCAERGEDYYVGWLFGEDGFGAFLEEGHGWIGVGVEGVWVSVVVDGLS